MLKNNKFKLNNKVIYITLIILIISVGLIINGGLFKKENNVIESINSGKNVEKGYEDIKNIEISELYSEGGEKNNKNTLTIENTVDLEKIITLFNQKVPLPDEYYCVLYDNKLAINKNDGSVEEYTFLIGDKYILINDKVMNHRIEDAEAVLEFTKMFNELNI